MITLRTFAEADLRYFETLPGPAEDPFSFFGLRGAPVAQIRPRWSENRLIDDNGGVLAVDLAGTVIGDVSWRVMPYGPPPMSNSFNIGIRIRPDHQGSGHGTAAQIALADYLFGVYPVNRIEASTDVTNRAEQRSLEKAGFTREGVLRGAQWRAGSWHDLVGFSRLRDDQSA